MNITSPWFWGILYLVGFFIVLGVLWPFQMRTRVYSNRIPRPVVMAFMLVFMILPPLVLPFTGGPGIGMPWILSVGLGGVIFGANIIIKVMSQKRIGVVPAIKALAFLIIIYFEETVLMDQYGQEYLAYKQKVPWRMIPGII